MALIVAKINIRIIRTQNFCRLVGNFSFFSFSHTISRFICFAWCQLEMAISFRSCPFPSIEKNFKKFPFFFTFYFSFPIRFIYFEILYFQIIFSWKGINTKPLLKYYISHLKKVKICL